MLSRASLLVEVIKLLVPVVDASGELCALATYVLARHSISCYIGTILRRLLVFEPTQHEKKFVCLIR